jgi:hypothetical protein
MSDHAQLATDLPLNQDHVAQHAHGAIRQRR